ncbi:metalloregulator ArsR/SmtB family transcription factor [Methyloceanibacter methanicus]|uniref:ArsR/SmtB family transcription factor n=1 Tax=Methyloceanibacter methanicus TaxID=1774968 RepID=UPI0031389FB6
MFHALANVSRRNIVRMLSKKPYRITELAPKFDMSLAAVSKHVQALERAGIVDREVNGREHICRLNADALSEAHEWLDAYQGFWSERLDALQDVLKQHRPKRGGKMSPDSD